MSSVHGQELEQGRPADLFSSLCSEHDRLRRDGDDDDSLTVPSQEIDKLARVLFSKLKTGGFCTTLVAAHRSWDCRGEAFEAARAAARRGCRIERAFLLPGRHLRHDATLRQHLELDRDAGIQVLVLDMSDLLPTLDLPPEESLDFGLWDEAIVCSAVYRTGAEASGPSQWRVSSRARDLGVYRGLVEALRNNGSALAIDGDEAPEVEEPLATSAPLARLVAPDLCHRDPATGEDCSRAHGVWQYLRIFDAVPSPQRNPDFFHEALSQLAREGSCTRVLISGSCDYGMLAHLLHAYRTQDARAEVTVMDICETPLFLCKWYGNRVSHPVETRRSDILDYRTERPYDVICTHSFLYNFSPAVRKQVVAKWRELLRPGGKLVTSARLSGSSPEKSRSWTPDQRQAFGQMIYDEATRWRALLGIEPEQVAKEAKSYATSSGVGYSLGSRQDLADLFESGGFGLDRLDLVDWVGKVTGRQAGPGTNRPATYAHIVATRL